MPIVQVRIRKMNNGKIEVSCKAISQPHSRPYDTAADAKAVLLRFGTSNDAADAYLSASQEGDSIDAGEYEVTDDILKETGFAAA